MVSGKALGWGGAGTLEPPFSQMPNPHPDLKSQDVKKMRSQEHLAAVTEGNP